MSKITASQVMTKTILTAQPDWSVARLMDFFADNAISGAPVTENGEAIGVVSLTDIARNGALREQKDEPRGHAYYQHGLENFVGREEMARFHIDPEEGESTVRDIMTPMVFGVEEDATVQEVAEMMLTGRIHRVVVRRLGKMVGVISAMDLLPLVRDM